MTPDRVRGFPWRSLDPTTRWEANAVRAARRWATSQVDISRLGLSLSEMLGTRVEVLIGRALPLAEAPATSDAVGVVVARAGGSEAAGRALIEAEGVLAATVVARVLRRPVAAVVNVRAVPSTSVAGAFAAIVLAAARRAHVGIAMRLLEAGAAPALEADLSRSDSDLAAVALTVLVGDDAFAARLVVSLGTLAGSGPAWSAQSLRALGPTPLSMPIVVCATCLSATEVSGLQRGDALIPLPRGRWPLVMANGCAAGPVLLAPPSFDLGLRAELGEGGRLVLRGGFERLPVTEAHMDLDEKDAMIATLGEVPVVVRVEIGEATMAAREWASLGRGDVIGLGRRVGELVVIRVGGVPLARGELVELEGEVAVRSVDRLVAEGTGAS